MSATYDLLRKVREVEVEIAQLRIDLACAEQCLRLICYSPQVNLEASRMANGYLREKARHRHCTECGERGEFICKDGTVGCYNCAANAGDP